MAIDDLGWAPDTCTLPTDSQPVRVAEFDALFSAGLRGQQRRSSTTLSWEFDPASMPAARALAERESQCCTFFTFDVAENGVEVTVPADRTDVLDALEQRAAAHLPTSHLPTSRLLT